MVTEAHIREVKGRHSVQLLSLPHVYGVGIQRDDTGEYYLAVHIASAEEEALSQLPQQIEGIRVKAIQSGPFVKQS